LELQVFHTPREEVEETDEDGKKKEKDESGGHRRLQAEEAEDSDNKEKPTVKKHSKSDFKHGAVSILFSVNEATAGANGGVFRAFFDSLKLGKENPEVEAVAIKSALEEIDWTQRWVYKGSKTQPPCEQFVYWNVLKTVYPISQADLDHFKAKMREIQTEDNWREV